MPLYQYKCDVCGHAVEQLRPMKDAKRLDQCPECAKQCDTTQYGILQPVISAPSFTPAKWGDSYRYPGSV